MQYSASRGKKIKKLYKETKTAPNGFAHTSDVGI